MATKTKATQKMTAAQLKAWKERHHEFLVNTVASDHRKFIEANRHATLGDLLTYLIDVQGELYTFDEDEVLAEIIGELDVAATYLNDFSIDEPVDGDGELATVGYRLENVEEDIGHVEELIEESGDSFPVSRLPKKKPWKAQG